MLRDEGGIHNAVLDEVATELVQKARRGPRRRAIQFERLHQVIQGLTCLAIFEVPRQRDARQALDPRPLTVPNLGQSTAKGLFHHGDPWPRRGEVDLHCIAATAVGVVLNPDSKNNKDHSAQRHVAPGELLHHAADELLRL